MGTEKVDPSLRSCSATRSPAFGEAPSADAGRRALRSNSQLRPTAQRVPEKPMDTPANLNSIHGSEQRGTRCLCVPPLPVSDCVPEDAIGSPAWKTLAFRRCQPEGPGRSLLPKPLTAHFMPIFAHRPRDSASPHLTSTVLSHRLVHMKAATSQLEANCRFDLSLTPRLAIIPTSQHPATRSPVAQSVERAAVNR
jgi:hypothetical protein